MNATIAEDQELSFKLLLLKKLTLALPESHVCYLYCASVSTKDANPIIKSFALARLAEMAIEPGFILFMPAKTTPEVDEKLLKRFEGRRSGG